MKSNVNYHYVYLKYSHTQHSYFSVVQRSLVMFCKTVFHIHLFDYSVTGMSYLKFIGTIRVSIHKFQNLERELYSCNANIYFNQKCSRRYTISNSYNTNKMHYFSTLFGKELYMFRTDLLSIIRSVNTVFTLLMMDSTPVRNMYSSLPNKVEKQCISLVLL